MDRYVEAVRRSLEEWGERLQESADTLYFGGGTPSLLGGRRLSLIMERAAETFGLEKAEITLEANPADDLAQTLQAFVSSGGNRLSLGMQSADEGELRWLGRRHTPQQTAAAVRTARAAGIRNLSLDLMLGLDVYKRQPWDHLSPDSRPKALFPVRYRARCIYRIYRPRYRHG